MLNITRRAPQSLIRSSLIPALASLPLWLAAGCTTDQGEGPEAAAGTQDILSNCVIHQPYGWSVGVNVCAGSPFRTNDITLMPCHQVTVPSAVIVGHGQGSVTLVCHCNGDGLWDEVNKICEPADNN